MKALGAVLALAFLLAGACSSDAPVDTIATTTTSAPGSGTVPDREADLIGTVTAVQEGDGQGGRLGTVLVEGDLAPEQGRKISYTVTEDTVITGTVSDVSGLEEGQLAETWAGGPCAESYPEQCTLAAIRVTG